MSEPTQTKSLKRGRGRPRLFDRTAAIQQAMVLFWDRGYEGTTFDDLIGAMKLNPSSFYHEFRSKEQLYREAVDYYFNLSSRHLRGFSSHRDTRAAFEALIEEAAAFFTNDASPAGCMISLAGTHLPPHLRSVADYTKSLRKLFEEALASRLRKGVSDGDLPAETNIKELAAYFDHFSRAGCPGTRWRVAKTTSGDLPSGNASLAFKTSGLESQGSPPRRHPLTRPSNIMPSTSESVWVARGRHWRSEEHKALGGRGRKGM